MTETPEQRRERLAQVVRQNIDLGRLGNALQVARDVADAIIASDEAAGMVVVPVEPTEKMINTGTYAWMHRDLNNPGSYPLRDCWRAMIAAAKEQE